MTPAITGECKPLSRLERTISRTDVPRGLKFESQILESDRVLKGQIVELALVPTSPSPAPESQGLESVTDADQSAARRLTNGPPPLAGLSSTRTLDKNKRETTLDAAAVWRHPGAMLADSKTPSVRTLDRINLRLSAETFEAIDASRVQRPGNISRNTWITEAIQEKLARDRADSLKGGGSDHA